MNDLIKFEFEEYESMKEEIRMLNDTRITEKINGLIEIFCEQKNGLYLGDFTEDITLASIKRNWAEQNSEWDNV
jgi:hypothetical protein